MENNVGPLEEQVLQMLLAGDDPVLITLRCQLKLAKRRSREYTGVGFFTHFDVPKEAPQFSGNPSIKFGDVIAEMDGLQRGAGFLLFIQNGVLSMLEGYTYEEPWPQKVARFELRYTSGTARDLSALRKTIGWPDREEKTEMQ